MLATSKAKQRAPRNVRFLCENTFEIASSKEEAAQSAQLVVDFCGEEGDFEKQMW